MTLVEKILKAVSGIKETFTTSEMVVACWEKYPENFSLDGYQLPDSNKVIATLCHKNGLMKRGLLARVAPNTYKMTGHGKLIANGESTPENERPKIIKRLHSTIAFHLFSSMKKSDIGFTDACKFWQVFSLKEKIIDAAADTESQLSGLVEGEWAGEARALLNMSDWLRSRFEKHLKLLERRAS